MKLKKNFELIKYGKANITIHEIVNTVFDFLISKKIDKIVICDSIKNILLEEMIQLNKKTIEEKSNDKIEKYFFDKSENLKGFMLLVYISSLISIFLKGDIYIKI
jgi:hypothetical protein